MWSQYDEDLSQNDFFKHIKTNHEDILKKASDEHWIICIPRRGSLSNGQFSMDLILDHVLVPSSDSIYTTLSKKELYLDNHHLKLDKKGIFHTNIEVLFEETHYILQTLKYLVWCINGPFFQPQTHHLNINNNLVLTNTQDCIDFLYSETNGYTILEGIKNLCENFWRDHEHLFATETLQSQKDNLGNLYSQCLQLCFKNDIIREKSIKNFNYLDNFKLSIETYMQYCLGKRLLYSVNTLNYFADCMINKTLRNSSGVTLGDLGISSDFNEFMPNARYELLRLNNFFTVLDKINCLSRIFNMFNNKPLKNSDKNIQVSSDDFLQILVYLILNSTIPNWLGNLVYLKELQFSNSTHSNQANFLVTTLEAAIAFIKSSQFMDLKSNVIDHESSFFDKLYKTLKETRNIAELNVTLAAQKVVNRAALCHPLCSCSKCQEIVSLLKKNNPLQVVNSSSQNFLIRATLENDREFVEFLLSLEFLDINHRDCSGKTAIHYASACGFQDIVLLLINCKADVNMPDNDRNTPLHLACDKGHENCVKGFIYSSYYVEINLQNNSGETPLFLATRWGYFDIVRILLENGASVCVKNNRNVNVFKLSPNYYISRLFTEFGKHRSSKILEEVENCKNQRSLTDLDLKVDVAQSQKASADVSRGIQPKTASDLKKIELLLKVIENNDMPLMCFYLGFSTNENSLDNEGNVLCHPLCTCSKCSQTSDPDEIGDISPNKLQNFNINMCNKDGFTPLHVAAKYGRTEILRVLLDGGSLLNVRTYETLYTPLHLAVMFQRVQTVKELLQCGNCEIDTPDYKGNTPLYYACVSNNNLKIVELLLKNGAECQKKNFEGRSVLQACEEKNLFRVCRMLRDSMGLVLSKEKEGGSRGLAWREIDADLI
ncbi:ankyrin repeat domain-containing protein 27-like [Euwallacea fornicatus]|uniref:ankyrin repeat domain-containing protein 27-like n=1 Tax=Euwallacea fornicatus TaxID=995702 RepID=UPI0033900A4B